MRDQPLATQEPAAGGGGGDQCLGGEAGSGLGLSPRETLEGTRPSPPPGELQGCPTCQELGRGTGGDALLTLQLSPWVHAQASGRAGGGPSGCDPRK